MERTYKIGIAFFVIAFVLRFWCIGDMRSYRGDESVHVPAAFNYIESGHMDPEKWFQPPLRHLLLFGSMKIFGDNPYGWRMRNVLLGSLSVMFLFFLLKELFTENSVPVMATLFFMFDPLHILFSRSTFGEVPAVFFLLLCMYFTALYVKGNVLSIPFAGVSLGLAFAMKWYYIPIVILLIPILLVFKYRDSTLNFKTALNILLSLLVLPLFIYMLSFYQWFGRGYDLLEFAIMHVHAYHEQQLLTFSSFKSVLAANSSPWIWFIKPIIFGFKVSRDSGWAQFKLFMNNPPVLFFTLPSLGYLVYHAYQYRDWKAIFISVFFVFMYIQFALVKRPVLIYSLVTVLPFVYLMIAYAYELLARNWKLKMPAFRVATISIVIWGLYLYPLAVNIAIPEFLYRPLLNIARIF